TENVDSEVRSYTRHIYNTIAKINYAATPEHQGQIAFQGQPYGDRQPGLYGPANQAGAYTTNGLTTDLSAKWTSKFNDNKTEVEAIIGWHRDFSETKALQPSLNDQPLQELIDGNLSTWSTGFNESMATQVGCADASDSAHNQ